MTDHPEDRHMTPEQVSGYLDRALTAPEQAAVEEHLAQCQTCRTEMVEVARVRRASPRWRRWYVTVPALAAAAAVLVLAVPTEPPAPTTGTLRGASSEGIPRFGTVAPERDRLVPADSVVFVWRGAGADANYRIAVTDPAGSQIWTDATTDTSISIPRGVQLGRGGSYFWYVDALFPNGRTATTGPKEFRTAP